MRFRSRLVLFIVFFIEICILVLYVVTDNANADWNLQLNFGYIDSPSKVFNNRSNFGTLIENVTFVSQRNLHEGRTGKRLSDMRRLTLSASKTHSFLNVGVYKNSVDVKSGTLKTMIGTSKANPVAYTRNLHHKQIPSISDVEKSTSYSSVTAETRAPADHYLVCPEPYGRLGNMMFQYAASVGIAHNLHYKHVISPSHTLLKYFEMTNTWEKTPSNVITIQEEKWKDREWRQNKKYLPHNLTIFGYFQSWKYFQNISDQIRTSLRVKSYYLEQARTFLKENVPGLKERIGIHIRRGDFLTEAAMNEGRVVAKMDYINRAMSYFRRNYKDMFFIVVSDDMQWCRDNIRSDGVIFSPFEKPITDMAIMSLCDHMIITVGSFSWWGGWLSGGTVVYLKDFPKPGSDLDKYGMNRKEYYPPEWIGLSNG